MSSFEYYSEEGYPHRCPHCEGVDIGCRVLDRIEGTVCEEEYFCESCGEIIGLWAYGYWDPAYTGAKV